MTSLLVSRFMQMSLAQPYHSTRSLMDSGKKIPVLVNTQKNVANRFIENITAFMICCAVAVSACGHDNPNRISTTHRTAITSSNPAIQPTKYPIVLLHGFFGWQQIFKVDYFYRVPEYLNKLGFNVSVTQVSPVNTVALRAAQLAPQIDKILAQSGAEKVNLVAHSMGGLDARYLISVLGYGDRIASVTTIGTPHKGSLIADILLGLVEAHQEVRDVARTIFHGASALFWHSNKIENLAKVDIDGALNDLSTAYVTNEFSKLCPDDDRVYYQSWSGQATFRHRFKPDILDPIVSVTHKFIALQQGENDGVVSIASAVHGVYRGIVQGDHLDEIGQLLGREPEGFDHKEFYRDVAKDLAEQGY